MLYIFFLLNYDRIVLHTGRFMKTVPSAMCLDYIDNDYRITEITRAEEPEPEAVGAGCFWLLGAGENE